MVAAGVGLEHRPAILGELVVEPQAWRDILPDEVRKLREYDAGGPAVLVELVLLPGEGLVAVVAHPEVDRQAIVHPPGIVDENAQGLGVAAVAERYPGVAVGVGVAIVLVGEEQVVVAVDAAALGFVVLHPEAEVVAAAQKLVGEVRHLYVHRLPFGREVVPVVPAAGDLTGIVIHEARLIARLVGIARSQEDLGEEAGGADLDDGIVRQDAGIARTWGRGRADTGRRRRGSRVGVEGVRDVLIVLVVGELEGVARIELQVQLAEVSVFLGVDRAERGVGADG